MRLYFGLFVVLGASVLAGCQEKTERSAEPAASVDRNAAIDPAVAKAVAAASARAAMVAPSASGGPPPNGVFAAGMADKELARGLPPKLTLGGTGSEPRVALGSPQPKPGWKAHGNIQVVMQADPRQGGLPIDLSMSLEAQKASGEGGSGSGASFVSVTAKVMDAKVGVTGVPRDVEARIGALKGARVLYQVGPDGAGSNYRTEAGAGAAEVRDQLRMLEDALALVTLPRPTQPVGVGAVWMATSRDGVFGMDLVTYRLVKVEEVKGETVTLSIGTKRYAASDKFTMLGLDANAPKDLLEFQAKSDGRLTFGVGVPFPENGEIQSVFAAALGEGGQQRGVVQVQSRIGLDFRKR